ncbi:MAG TPA: hypothetical protein VMM78_18345 [Thermomicrobiales bacterium]|nr:hypothetical protein [Thermomicrobiales bacterium]
MRAVYLTGDLIYVRALTKEDAKQAAAWFPEPFPIDPVRAERYLKETHSDVWDRKRRLVIARVADHTIAGSVSMRANRVHAALAFTMAPTATDADELEADAIRVLVPWLRDEAEHATVMVDIASDRPVSIAAAEELGLIAGARLREHVARGGYRVDLLMYQALNPRLVERGGRHA